MKDFNKLEIIYVDGKNTYYRITKKEKFEQKLFISNSSIKMAFDFAYGMAPESHREYRSGGSHIRKPNEIFINAFTGKLSEFALYEYLRKYDIVTDVPDTKIYPREKWDTEDLIITSNTDSQYKISVKSTKYFGNLMLLEVENYDQNGFYIPDDTKSDYYMLVRIQLDLENRFKSKKRLYDEKLIEKRELQTLINETIQETKLENSTSTLTNNKIFYDIPGYITHEDLVHIINNSFIIKRGDFLQKTKIDANNYYIQSGDLRKN